MKKDNSYFSIVYAVIASGADAGVRYVFGRNRHKDKNGKIPQGID